jgi:hypothetical protein
MDQFMTSVRALETNIQSQGAICSVGPRPPEAIEDMNVPPDYNRDVHANLMIDLMVMALECDLTRVISQMMDDDRSLTPLTFLDLRHFTATGSTLTNTPLSYGSYNYNASGENNDGFATVNYWFVEKLVRLCQKMLSIEEGPNGSLLDQSVVWFGSNFHGSNHDALDLPLIYVGSGGGRLKVDQHIDFATTPAGPRELANVYLTILQKVFDLPVSSFGTGPPTWSPVGNPAVWTSVPGPPLGVTVVPEILV